MADDQSLPPRSGEPVDPAVGSASSATALSPDASGPRTAPPGATAPAPDTAPPPAPARRRTRGRLFAILGLVVAVAAIAYGLYWFLVASHFVKTDDAYVGADVAQITPQIAGTVQDVRVSDTQAVRKGDILVLVDPADSRAAAEQAQAQFGQAERKVRQYFAGNVSAAATIAGRQADLARAQAQSVSAQSEVQRTRVDLQRRQALAASGAVSGEELTTAQNAAQVAVANLAAARAAEKQASANVAAARAEQTSQLALTQGTDVDTNPEVQAAKAQLDVANLNASRSVIRAPFDGVVSRRQVQVGQRVPIGQQLMTVVPVDQVYVDANFKEVQLRGVRIGQRATLKSDYYGDHFIFHGRVAGFSGGTGSAFAVIPAQNATGNWIKVVQRLPVRIRLDPAELRRHPLRVGLSMAVSIDVTDGGRPADGRSGDARDQG